MCIFGMLHWLEGELDLKFEAITLDFVMRIMHLLFYSRSALFMQQNYFCIIKKQKYTSFISSKLTKQL